MRKLLNTLFVISEDAYLTLDGENAVILRGEEKIGRFTMHTLESILCFSYKGASPAFMGGCAQRGISLSFFTPRGKFLCRTVGKIQGNVLLRREQFRISDLPEHSLAVAKGFLVGKLLNSRAVLLRALRDHPQRIDNEAFSTTAAALANLAGVCSDTGSSDELRGIEGTAAQRYFALFDQMVLQNHEAFCFTGRSRRPPLDRINAVMSFVYTLLTLDCANALEGVGLDPCVGFLHTDRPGRQSLALDLMEELRPALADRLTLSLINTRALSPQQFDIFENGAVFLNDSGRKCVLTAWQERKREEMTHPFLGEKIAWGLIPHVQALLLARYIRGDIDGYPPFLWR